MRRLVAVGVRPGPTAWRDLAIDGANEGNLSQALVRYEHRAARTAPVVATLVQRGFDTLMLKGVPLGITYDSKPALRPMADIDVVVPTAQAHAAIALLRDAGWTPGPTARDEDVDFRHSMQLVDAEGMKPIFTGTACSRRAARRLTRISGGPPNR